MILPARSQILRKIKVTDPSKDFVVVNQEIHPGTLVANSIVNSQNPYILIPNTNEENTIIDYRNLEDYDIVEFSKEHKQRNKIVLEKRKQNFPQQFDKTEIK